MNYFKLKFLLLFFALAVAIPPAWAGTVTFTAGTDVSNTTSITKDNITFSVSSGTLNRTDNYRAYANANATISISKGNITGIVFNCNAEGTNKGGPGCWSTNTGSYSYNGKVGTWSGSANEIQFTTTQQVQINSFTVTYEDGGSTVEKVKTPTFSVEPGTYYEAKSVSLSCETENATIHYTTDGSDPDENSDVYSSAINVDKTMTIKAIAMKDGMDPSSIAEAVYTIIDPSTLTQYRKITNMSEFKDGDYLIVCENNNVAFNGSLETIDAAGNYFGVEIKNSVISTNVEGYFTVQKVSGGNYKFRSASGYAIGRDENKNGMNTSNSATVYLNKVSFDNDGNALITGLNSANEETIDLQFFNSGNNSRFRYYLTTQQPIQLYKKVTGDEPVVETVATPTFSVEEGSYTEAQTVTITCATEGATIYYTTDGTEPTASSTEYTGAISINETTTLKAIAVKDGQSSAVAEATYTISEPAAPLANEFVLVTDINQLAHGKQIIFVSTDTKNDYADAMSSQQKSNNRGVETVAVTENKTVTLNDNGISPYSTEIFTLEKDGDYWYFKANKTSGYIYAAGGTSNNYLKTSESKIDNAQATISIDGKAIVTFNVSGTGARNLLSYNPNNSPAVYSCYKAEQKPVYIYVEKGDTPEPEPLAVTLPEVPAEHYKVGQEVKVKATVENGSENTLLTYKVGEETLTPDNEGNVTLPNKKAGDVVVTVKATDGDRTANDSKTYVFDAAEALTITLNPANGEYYVGAEAKVNVTVDKAITTNPTITYKFGEEGEAQTYNAENGIVLPTAEAGTINLTVTVDDNGYEHTGANTATGTYTVKNKPLTITLDPASGEYTVGKEAKVKVTIENVVGESDVEYVASYTVNDEVKTQKLTANEGYVTLPNDKAVTYTLTVTALDERMEEVTATGTYTFTAAPAFEITLTPNTEGNYTVGDNAVVTVAVDKYIDEDYLVTYTIGDSEEQIEYNAKTGIVLPNDKAGDVTVKVYVTDGYDHEGEGTATATYHFDAAPAIVVTLDPAEGSYTVGTEVKVNVKIENTIGEYLATYTINDGDEQEFDGNDIVIPSDQIATVTLAVSVTDAYHDGVTTVTGQYVFSPMPVVAMPTFSLVAGSYTGPQTVIINCATEDATISYSTDGGQTWTKGNTVNVDKDMTIMAKAEKDGMTVSTTASATYVIITEETPETVNIETGYYQIKNLGNGLYANVAGRKTLNFTNAPADKAGTVIYVDVENNGTVKSLRSQAADLQRYADRAMSYVPEVVKIVAKKLNADGSSEILGETGLNKILDKFNECFDHNLHVEQAEGGYRLYGKTPSMQPVVEFYRENKDKVEAKLPNLEAFINSALEKLKAKIGGSSVFTEFKLLDIWEKMGGTLTKPVDPASTMAFYREVLNNKNYVWDFAYQTAMIYVNNLMSHPRWPEVEDKLGEYAQYIDKIKQIRPEFKYYIVQKDGKPDFISEGNKDIIDNAERTIWTLEPRTDFTVNFPEANKHNGEYVTTLYTDFAYTLPEGVTAYTVTEVSTQGVATLTALEGTIPAQTPVLLKSTAAGPQTVTLSTKAGTAPADNLLVGPDYLIKHYEFKTPQVVDIFNFIKDKLPGFYDEYVAQYEYLMLKTAGTVGNKYFWNVNSDLANLKDDCIVRSLAVDENGTLAFSDHWTTETNKAFLVDDANNPQDVIKLSLRGDINKDGVISIIDVTALIDILLDLPARTYLKPTTSYPKGLDYEAADVNEINDIEITDVTSLIDILLNMPDQPAQGSGN